MNQREKWKPDNDVDMTDAAAVRATGEGEGNRWTHRCRREDGHFEGQSVIAGTRGAVET